MRIPWRLLAIALLPGGFIAGGVALAVYLRRRWLAKDAAHLDGLIAANRATPKEGFGTFDESLRERTDEKRDIAKRMHRKAAKVESGAAAAELLRDELRVVKR